MSGGFKRAERRQVKLKLGFSGASGSGKTFSGLKVAKGLCPDGLGRPWRIAVIDSENRSASLYANMKGMPEFDTLELQPPYTVDKYIDAIELAIQGKYDVLIVDSVSHVWSGEGGLLQEKESLDARGGNSYTNWAKMTPKWNRFLSGILHSDIHMICTMRSKQDYVLETNDKGKQAPRKVGMAPQVREGFEYELTAVFDMDMAHQAQASKDRTSLFDGRIWKPDEKTGQEIWAWLQSGKAAELPPPPAPAAEAKPETKAQKVAKVAANIKAALLPEAAAKDKRLRAAWNQVNWPSGSISDYCQKAYGVSDPVALPDEQFEALLVLMQGKTALQARSELGQPSKKPEEAKAKAEPKRGKVEPEPAVPWDQEPLGVDEPGAAG